MFDGWDKLPGMSDELRLLLRGRRLGRDGVGRAIREAAGLSLRDLGELIRVQPSGLSRWERGEELPSRSAAIRWAAAIEEIEEELARLNDEGGAA